MKKPKRRLYGPAKIYFQHSSLIFDTGSRVEKIDLRAHGVPIIDWVPRVSFALPFFLTVTAGVVALVTGATAAWIAAGAGALLGALAFGYGWRHPLPEVLFSGAEQDTAFFYRENDGVLASDLPSFIEQVSRVRGAVGVLPRTGADPLVFHVHSMKVPELIDLITECLLAAIPYSQEGTYFREVEFVFPKWVNKDAAAKGAIEAYLAERRAMPTLVDAGG